MPWMEFAFGELLADVREVPGPGSNIRILEYLATTNTPALGGDSTSWCSAYTNFCLRMARIVGTNSAAARSWLKWGVPCEPRVGAIGVLWRESQSSWKGHVGFVVGANAGAIHLLGGNQGDRVSIASFPITMLLGCRMIHM